MSDTGANGVLPVSGVAMSANVDRLDGGGIQL
jgi:hypothetical protein